MGCTKICCFREHLRCVHHFVVTFPLTKSFLWTTLTCINRMKSSPGKKPGSKKFLNLSTETKKDVHKACPSARCASIPMNLKETSFSGQVINKSFQKQVKLSLELSFGLTGIVQDKICLFTFMEGDR